MDCIYNEGCNHLFCVMQVRNGVAGGGSGASDGRVRSCPMSTQELARPVCPRPSCRPILAPCPRAVRTSRDVPRAPESPQALIVTWRHNRIQSLPTDERL